MSGLYENDKIAWAKQQIEYLKNDKLDLVDIEHVIEELEDMGDSQYEKLESYLEVLLTHLLKYNYQINILQDRWVENCVIHTWLPSINNSRNQINKILKKKASLEKRLDEALEISYELAKSNAIGELNYYIKIENNLLNSKSFPDLCPWKTEEMLKINWLPDEKI